MEKDSRSKNSSSSEAMNGFDIALEGVSSGGNADMLAVTKRGREIAFELAAVVGLPDQIAQRDVVAMQMMLDAGSEDSAGGSERFCAKAQKNKPLRTSRAVYWITGKPRAGLGPVVRDIV